MVVAAAYRPNIKLRLRNALHSVGYPATMLAKRLRRVAAAGRRSRVGTGARMSRILLVEDDPLQRSLIERVLHMAGHTVWLAGNGVDAIALAMACYPELILMDVLLPEMNGLEATRQLKANSLTRHIPVIALTAYQLIDSLIAQAYGCDDFAIKPVSVATLLAKVDRFCRADRAAECSARS